MPRTAKAIVPIAAVVVGTCESNPAATTYKCSSRSDLSELPARAALGIRMALSDLAVSDLAVSDQVAVVMSSERHSLNLQPLVERQWNVQVWSVQ